MRGRQGFRPRALEAKPETVGHWRDPDLSATGSLGLPSWSAVAARSPAAGRGRIADRPSPSLKAWHVASFWFLGGAACGTNCLTNKAPSFLEEKQTATPSGCSWLVAHVDCKTPSLSLSLPNWWTLLMISAQRRSSHRMLVKRSFGTGTVQSLPTPKSHGDESKEPSTDFETWLCE